MIDLVIARIVAGVPDLAGRVEAAADLAALMAANGLPQHQVAAHVLPLGLQGGAANAATGSFTQSVEEVVAVLLTFQTASRTGSRALERLREIIQAVIAAVAGWGPDEAAGVFRLLRGGLLRFSGGTLVYQIDFAITDQLRIIP